MSQPRRGMTSMQGQKRKKKTSPQARPPQPRPGARPRQPVGHTPPGDGGVTPDEPDDGEFELIGDNDLGAADLGPAAPGARDPDAGCRTDAEDNPIDRAT